MSAGRLDIVLVSAAASRADEPEAAAALEVLGRAVESRLGESGTRAQVRSLLLSGAEQAPKRLKPRSGDMVVVALDIGLREGALTPVLETVSGWSNAVSAAPLVIDIWDDSPEIARALSRRIAESLDGAVLSEWALLFAAPRLAVDDDRREAYVEQIQRLMVEVLPLLSPGRWDLGFFGREAGSKFDPSVGDVVLAYQREGWRKALIVPLGETVDKAEIRTVFDGELRERAIGLGVGYRRVGQLAASAYFAAALAETIQRHVAGSSLSTADAAAYKEPNSSLARGLTT